MIRNTPFQRVFGILPRRRADGSTSIRLTLEQLESRHVPSTFDWYLPAGGGEFWLSLQNQQLTLKDSGGVVLEQVDANGNTVNLFGTGAAERIHFEFDQIDASTGLVVNAQTNGGGDEALINLSSAVETVNLAPKSALVQASNYQMQILGAETVHSFGGGGVDVLRMNDGPGEDVVESSLSLTSMTKVGVYYSDAAGFENITIDADVSEMNRARVYGMGTTFTKMNGALVTATDYKGPALTGATLRTVTLTDFKNVDFRALVGYGCDYLNLYDSTRNDELIFSPTTGGKLTRGDGFVHTFSEVDRTFFFANRGGSADSDIARLFDTPGMETFKASGTTGVYLDGLMHWELTVYNAEVIGISGVQGGLNVLTRDPYAYTLYYNGFYPDTNYAFGSKLTRPVALYWIKQIALQLDPTLGNFSGMPLAGKLMDFIHDRVNIAPNTTAWPSQDAYGRFLQAIVSRKEGVLCQGMAWLYRDLLEAFGIAGREVSMFAKNGWTHASVEVSINGRWIVMDPTYRASFTDQNGNYLSYQQMKSLGTWKIVHTEPNRLGLTFDETTSYAIYLDDIRYPPLWV